MATGTETRATLRYWLILTGLMAVAVLVVGLVPVPWVYYAGLAIFGAVLLAGWKIGWQPPGAETTDSNRSIGLPVYATFLALMLAQLLRESVAAVVLVPLLALAVPGLTLWWLRSRKSRC